MYTMDNKQSMSNSTNKDSVPTKFQHKGWVKKLEAVSGKPIEFYKFGRVVYLVIDCSGSMAEHNKIEQAKKGAIGFADVAQKKGYSVGLIQFASYAEHMVEPQNELTSLKANVERISANGSTNMAAAIRMAIDYLSDKASNKVI